MATSMVAQSVVSVFLPRKAAAVSLPKTASIKATFGADAFLVHKDSQVVVPLRDDGTCDWDTAGSEGDEYELVYGQKGSYRSSEQMNLRVLDGDIKSLKRELARLNEQYRQFSLKHFKQLDVIKSVSQVGVDNSSVKRAVRKAHFDFNVEEDVTTSADDEQLKIKPLVVEPQALVPGPERVGSPSTAVMTPIGYLESVFLTKNGTPRQGFACAAARAKLTVNVGANSNHYLEGLEEFSHVWILFLFHDNGGGIGLKAKIQAPKREGEKTGLFATRTPHRPNPIGLSLCRLDRIEGATLHLSAVDLIHGTPIFDVKPYLPRWDSVPENECRIASWLRQQHFQPLTVSWQPEALETARALEPSQLRLFHTTDELVAAIEDVLKSDPRSVYRKNKHADDHYRFGIDRVDVVCTFDKEHVTISAIELLKQQAEITIIGQHRPTTATLEDEEDD